MPRTHDSQHTTQHQPPPNNLTEKPIDLQGFHNLPHPSFGAPSNFAAASSSFDTAAAVRKELIDAWTAQLAQNRTVGQQEMPPMRLNGLSAQMVVSMMRACTHPAALAQNPQLAAILAQTLALQAAEHTSQRVAELAARQAVMQAAQQLAQHQQHVNQMIAQLSHTQQAAAEMHTSSEMPVQVLIPSLKYISTRMCLCKASKREPVAF